jgi:hypothetical protein
MEWEAAGCSGPRARTAAIRELVFVRGSGAVSFFNRVLGWWWECVWLFFGLMRSLSEIVAIDEAIRRRRKLAREWMRSFMI